MLGSLLFTGCVGLLRGGWGDNHVDEVLITSPILVDVYQRIRIAWNCPTVDLNPVVERRLCRAVNNRHEAADTL